MIAPQALDETDGNMRRFNARAVSATELEVLDTFVVCLAENSDGSGMRLEIQRALSFDEQDKRLGQDTYCLSTEDGATHYGGIRSWRFSDESLEIMLEPSAATALGVSDGFVVHVQADERSRQVLLDGLRRVLNELS